MWPTGLKGLMASGGPKDEWDGMNSLRAINEASTQPWQDMMSLLEQVTAAPDEPSRTRALRAPRGRRMKRRRRRWNRR